jgi:DNA-binding transcriptional LysR family regulator
MQIHSQSARTQSADLQMNWDDLQYFLAVCERSSISGAAQALGVNHSTVLRRIASLEHALGVRLFDRLPSGYALTTAGHELVDSLDGVAERIAASTRRLMGGDLQIGGTLRLTTTDTLLQSLLTPLLAEFSAAHPQLQLQVVSNNSMMNLTQREADVAVRGSNRPPDNLVGRRAGAIQTALYASKGYLQRLGKRRDDASAWRWVAPDEALAHLAQMQWLRTHVPDERIAMRLTSLAAMVDAVAAGVGVGLLLCPLAQAHAKLVRLQPPMESLDTQVWVLTHPDLRSVARVKALTDFLYERLSADPRLSHAPLPRARR